MNKEIFIQELKSKLRRLPMEEVENILAYYNDYFEDATISEEEVIKDLGSPAAVASQILADLAFNTDNTGTVKGRKNKGNTILLSILAIFAAPIALPLALALILVLLALVIVVVSLMISFAAVGLALFLGGVASCFAGLAVITQGPTTTMIFLGGGLFVIGLGMLVIAGMKELCPRIWVGFKKLTQKIIFRINKSGKGEINNV